MSKKPKTVNYRKAELTDKGGKVTETLEDLVNRALASENIPKPVRIDYGIEGSGAHLLLHSKQNNRPYYREGCLCGRISFYDDDTKVSLVDSEYNEDKGEVFNEYVEPLDSKQKRRKLEQQAHYFAIQGNHVAYMASSGKGVDMLQDFFTGLIQDVSGISDAISIKLVNIPRKYALEKVAERPVRSFSFKSSAYTQHVIPMTEQEIEETKAHEKKERKEYLRKTYAEGPILKALCNVLKCDSILDAYEKDDDLDGLCVEVEFKYTRKRKESSGKRFVQDLARHVGGIEDLSPVIKLEGGSCITKDELTIKSTLLVEAKGKNLNPYEAMRVLAEWLVSEIKTGLE